MSENWKQSELESIERWVRREIAGHQKYIQNAHEVAETAKILIEKSESPISLSLTCISKGIHMFRENKKTINNLIKSLNIRFKRTFDTSSGKFNYRGEINGIPIKLYNVEDPSCKLIPITKTVTKITYKVICP